MREVNQFASEPVPERLPSDLADEASLWTAFRAAVQFLTRLPIATEGAVSAAALRRCPLFFPLVGALIGIITAGSVALGSLVWPVWLAVLVALAVEASLTGALHEDAVADFCDAFGGGWTRDEVLAILKDSRIGTYGALGLFLAVSLRAAATVAIVLENGPGNVLVWGSAIIAASAIGRWVIVLGMVRVPPLPRPESLTRDVGRRLSGRDLLWAGLGGAPFALCFAYLQPWHCLAAIGLLVSGVWWFLSHVRRQLGGMTGDCLGCLGYVSQVLVLLAAAMRSELWSHVS